MTMMETIEYYRRLSVVNPGSPRDLADRDPAVGDLAVAQVRYEAKPFAALVAAIDAFFAGELAEALEGPESAAAEAEVRRIVAEQLATVTTRLAISGAALSQVNLLTASDTAVMTLAGALFQRNADMRFSRIVSPLCAAGV